MSKLSCSSHISFLRGRVVESTLVNLSTDSSLSTTAIVSNNNSKIIQSVHLIGAAIDNKLIVKNYNLKRRDPDNS
jgi:hypothetical protein